MATETLATVAADGAAGAFEHDGGLAVIACRGTWGGATITVQFSADGTNYVAFRDDSGFTADGAAAFDLPRCWLRVLAASTSSGTSVVVTITDDTRNVVN